MSLNRETLEWRGRATHPVAIAVGGGQRIPLHAGESDAKMSLSPMNRIDLAAAKTAISYEGKIVYQSGYISVRSTTHGLLPRRTIAKLRA